MFEYQRYGRYFAQGAHALEELLAAELAELGATRVKPAYRGVYFEADPATLYRVNHGSRLANHVLAPLVTFQCHSDKYLYKTARQIDWSRLLSPEQTFVIDAKVSDSRIRHSQHATLRLKDAISDHFTERAGRRPSVDRRGADLWLNLNIQRDRAIISVDTSGGSLHRRGYRTEARQAPLQETLAAAILRHAGWTGQTPLVDPLCGSGTLLAEAAMIARGMPPAWMRFADKPPFAALPDYDENLWKRVRGETKLRELPEGLIRGGDVDSQAVGAARSNLHRLPGGAAVKVERRDFRESGPFEGVTLVCNPPYAKRLGERDEVEALYGQLGDFLKRRCKDSTAWILAGDTGLVKRIGLRPKRRIPIFNGPLECRLVEIPIYEGAR